jgi:hypothetical protein
VTLRAIFAVTLAASAASAIVPALPIPSDSSESRVPQYVGAPAVARGVNSFFVPRNPYMARNGRSNIHNDSYATDAYSWAGPLGRRPAVSSTWLGLEECASVGFDRRDRIVTLCGSLDGAKLRLIDATTLETLALMPLPPRSVRPGTTPFNDYCAAGYFYLDHRDRAVVSTNNLQIWTVAEGDGPAFSIERIFDLSRNVPATDCLVSVLPDWTGRLWFLTKGGIVGTIDPANAAIKVRAIAGETVQNSFAVDETSGVFIITDHALYRFDAGTDGAPRVSWRVLYDRGSRLKSGQLGQGSGTTPTLLSRDLVAITDNADPRMHVLVYTRGRKGGGRLVCSSAVFGRGASATENSLIAVGHSLIAENNYGYSGVTATSQGQTTTPGIARVDVDRAHRRCRVVWTSHEISPTTVAKASVRAGLVYLYTKPRNAEGVDAWYFTAIDFRTGRTAFKQLTGTGYLYNNHYAAISIGPDGAAYIGSLGGLIRIADTK